MTGDDPLRAAWDFGDLEGSERRLRAALEREGTDAGRAEVLTQLARVAGLRRDFASGERLLSQAEALAGESDVAGARIRLERGRLLRSGGDPAAALPLFESAYEAALGAGATFIAADAAHMAALAAPDHEGMLVWTARGCEVAEGHEAAAYWLGPLLNNIGWAHSEAGEHELALDAFERALAARERDPDRAAEIEIARYAVARTLRALGRLDEASEAIERAVSWAGANGEPDGWFHEEAAEISAALGREGAAREHARLALPLLFEADGSLADDAERLAGET